jgi:hypothetical protein
MLTPERARQLLQERNKSIISAMSSIKGMTYEEKEYVLKLWKENPENTTQTAIIERIAKNETTI